MLRDTARVGTDERKRRGPSEKRLILGLVVGLLLVLGMVGLAIAQWLDERPDAVRYRAHGIEVMRAELARIPPPAGAEYSGETVYNAPLKSLGLSTYYSLPSDGCAGMQAYYSPRLNAAGWASESLMGNGVTHITFAKDVDNYHLGLNLDCNRDGTYTIGIVNR